MKYLSLFFALIIFQSCNFMNSEIQYSDKTSQEPLTPGNTTTTTITTTTTTTTIPSAPIDRANGDTSNGGNLYITEGCITCHGQDGTGGAEDVNIVDSTDTEIYLSVTNGQGNMPPIPLSDEEIQDIAAYIGNGFVE